MGEGEPDIPDLEKFSSRKEEQEFSAIHFDPNVRRALEHMEHHGAKLEGEPSPIESMIAELLAEQKKPNPDLQVLDDLRGKIANEHAIIEAQHVPDEKLAEHLLTMGETQALNVKEARMYVVDKIMETRVTIDGLVSDMINMADDATGRTADDFPPELGAILVDAERIRSQAYSDLRLAFGEEQSEGSDLPPEALLDQDALMDMDSGILNGTINGLIEIRNQLIDQHTKMLKAASEWREKHQTK